MHIFCSSYTTSHSCCGSFSALEDEQHVQLPVHDTQLPMSCHTVNFFSMQQHREKGHTEDQYSPPQLVNSKRET